MVLLDVAPLSLSMEAFSPGERFFTLMNHELVHIATMDAWNDQDADWRHFFHGKVAPVTGNEPLTARVPPAWSNVGALPSRWSIDPAAIVTPPWLTA